MAERVRGEGCIQAHRRPDRHILRQLASLKSDPEIIRNRLGDAEQRRPGRRASTMGRKNRRAVRPVPPAAKAAGAARPDRDRSIDAREALRVAWMLATATTLVVELGFAGVGLAGLGLPANASLAALKALLGFTAVVLGAIALALTAVAHNSRRGPAPWSVTLGALAVGSAPLVALVAYWALGQG